MQKSFVYFICLVAVMVVFAHFAMNSARASVDNPETLPGSINAKQLEKIELMNELQGFNE